MKKLLLSIAVIIFAVSYSNAQYFSLKLHDVVIGDTIVINPADSTSTLLEFELIVTNLMTTDADVKVLRTEMEMISGATSYYCWGACYLDTTNLSPITHTIAAGASTEPAYFSGHYDAHGAIGASIVEYKFFDVDKTDQFVKVVVIFDNSPDAIEESIMNNIAVSDIYPNPADNFVAIDYTMPNEVENASVKIVNILGSVVKEQQIETRNNKLTLDISDINSGVYFYSILVNGEGYITKKLIVR